MRQMRGQWWIRLLLAFFLLGGVVTPLRAQSVSPAVGAPLRLRIPAIHVDAGVEHVGQLPDGTMALPQDYHDAAWYEPGPRPGEPGNAVIAGHVDWITDYAVFWNLRQLHPGDDIFVTGDDGTERHFIVTGMESYRYEDAPLDRIFGPATGAHLNLITCDNLSQFNRATAEYASSLVVYTDAA